MLEKGDGSRYVTNIMDLSLTHIHTSQKLNQLAECPKSVRSCKMEKQEAGRR